MHSTGPRLPDKAEWREFRASRNEFQPGRCDECWEQCDKLYTRGELVLCAECWWKLEDEKEAQCSGPDSSPG